MANNSIFDKETQLLEESAQVLEDDNLDRDALRAEYETLFKGYRRLVKQTQRLIKMSDRQQLELLELNELKNKFVGMAAHDLRSPCSIINGYSELMKSSASMDDAERDEFIGIINEVSGNMIKMLGDLLDVSAIESGRLVLEPAKGDLGDLIEQRVTFLSILSEKKDISLTCQKADGLPQISFDSDRMCQVIDNLITNAIKFSESGTAILVTADADDEGIRFQVADQGPGIPPEDLDKMFGTFQKLSNRPTGGEKSSGLGLAIVKKIITAHKGTINVESEVGKGSAFIVTIPGA